MSKRDEDKVSQNMNEETACDFSKANQEEDKCIDEACKGVVQQEEQENALSECKKERDYWKDQCLRAKADFENFKRRIEKEQAEWYQTAQAQVLLDLLTIMDNFDRALAEKEKEKRSPQLEVWLKGFELIHKSLQKILQKYEVEEITQIKEFDPHYHEAFVQVDSPDYKTGQIVDVIEKGYTFKGEVLRPAKVTVAQ